MAGGLLLTTATCAVAIAVFGLEILLNTWVTLPVLANLLIIAASTLLVSTLIWMISRYHLLMLPIIISLWFTILKFMDLIFDLSLTQIRWLLVIFCLGLVIVSFILERYRKLDHSFWFYLFDLIFLFSVHIYS